MMSLSNKQRIESTNIATSLAGHIIVPAAPFLSNTSIRNSTI